MSCSRWSLNPAGLIKSTSSFLAFNLLFSLRTTHRGYLNKDNSRAPIIRFGVRPVSTRCAPFFPVLFFFFFFYVLSCVTAAVCGGSVVTPKNTGSDCHDLHKEWAIGTKGWAPGMEMSLYKFLLSEREPTNVGILCNHPFCAFISFDYFAPASLYAFRLSQFTALPASRVSRAHFSEDPLRSN